MIAEPLLNAVLHLFALQAAGLAAPARAAAREKVLAYLHDHVGLQHVETYVGLFDGLLEVHAGAPEQEVLARAATLAERLRTLLHGLERDAVLLRFLAVAAADPAAPLPLRLALSIGETLGLPAGTLSAVLGFLSDPAASSREGTSARRLGGTPQRPFRGTVAVLRLPAEDLLLVAPVGDEPVRLEGRVLARGGCQQLSPGQVLRDAQGNELPFAEVAAAFGGEVETRPSVVLQGRDLAFGYPGSANGLHPFSFDERGGRLVAVMGTSGSGKSTLLGLLNGTLLPDSGQLLLNGHDVHAEPEAAEGVFGFIPQDDLLVEDLTVFENLYYAARLCRADLPEVALRERVRALLSDLGQAETADRKVGSPLEKTISGGQRKRLNIALELVREPTVLFVDEPTSGLSSSESEMVVSLLRQQAAHGRLVLVVIHQPSSKVFRMFDALWVLDQGGWPIFSGTPIEALAYFRSRGGLPGAEEGICPGCGSVHPEELLEIVESRLLDGSGRATQERKVTPRGWSEAFRSYREARGTPAAPEPPPAPPQGHLTRPGRLGQLAIYLARDVRARLASRSYVAVTLLEPPVLGLLLGLLTRGWPGTAHPFHDNEGVPSFLFMSVIVALFLGLSVSAEEICRDARTLQRERFLHLSWWSYVNAKVIYLALVAAVQTLGYLAVALPLVEVPGLLQRSWAVLFATALCASLVGLNVSASFRSAVTIYVLVPLLLIPQMLLGGVIIPYRDLISPTALRRDVPWYANLLPARWAYEALVVEQYAGNAYTRHVVDADAREKLAEDDLDFYLPELVSRVRSVEILREQGAPEGRVDAQLAILRRELALLAGRTGVPLDVPEGSLRQEAFDPATADRLASYLARVRELTFERRREAASEKLATLARLRERLGAEGLASLERTSTSRALTRVVLNLGELEPVGASPAGLFPRTLPIYRVPDSRWGSAPFLARVKRLGPWLVPTYAFDLGAILALAALFHLALGLRLLPRLVATGTRARRRLGHGRGRPDAATASGTDRGGR